MLGKQCFDACTRTLYFSEGGCVQRECIGFEPYAFAVEVLFWAVVYLVAAVMLFLCCKALGRYISKIEKEIDEDRRQKETTNESNTNIRS